MNGSRALAAEWAAVVHSGPAPACDLLVCPPFTLIEHMAGLLAGTSVAVGGQDCHAEADGAYTGDVTAAMLREAGATAVIVGHSERRAAYAEADATVRRKAEAALMAGLLPIVCVGETAAERQAGFAQQVIGRQLAGSLPPGFAGNVAYEPIWAIGTGLVPSLRDVADMHGFIRGVVGPGVRVLYGGSVKPDNAAGLLAVANVGGALVGGASLDGAGFLAVAQAVASNPLR